MSKLIKNVYDPMLTKISAYTHITVLLWLLTPTCIKAVAIGKVIEFGAWWTLWEVNFNNISTDTLRMRVWNIFCIYFDLLILAAVAQNGKVLISWIID